MDGELPSLIGVCSGDWPRLAAEVNRAQRRLNTCREAGETGWWGSYAEMVFNVTRNSPSITLPRGIARLISVNACEYPIEVNNQFYEYVMFGSGNWPKTLCGSSSATSSACRTQGFRRNAVCTFTDLASSGEFLRIYSENIADNGMRVMVGCRDINGTTQRQLDGAFPVQGLFATLFNPWVNLTLPGIATPLELSAITNIQKDVTIGYVHFYAVNVTTGAERLLLTMDPGETVAAYQRYYFQDLPRGCCSAPTVTDDSVVQVKAMVRLDLVPVVVDSDYLLIQSEDAIIAECQAVRFGDHDDPGGKTQAAERHREAVRYLQGQLVLFEGRDHPAISFKPFGSAALANQKIGTLI